MLERRADQSRFIPPASEQPQKSRFAYLAGNGVEVTPPSTQDILKRLYPEEKQKQISDGTQQHQLQLLITSSSSD